MPNLQKMTSQELLDFLDDPTGHDHKESCNCEELLLNQLDLKLLTSAQLL